jgi:hypothetical protein
MADRLESAWDNEAGGSPLLTHTHRVHALVRSAYHRCLLVLAVEQGARAASLPFAGLVVLLLLGTQILSWYWLMPLVLAGVGLAYWRIRRTGVTPYHVAQTVDDTLRLKDTISTAWYLTRHPELSDSPAASVQIAQANRLAADIDARQVFRIRYRSSWAVAGALATTAFALFGVRYFARDGMELHAPLIPLHFDQIAADLKNQFAAFDHSKTRNGPTQDQAESQTALGNPNDPFIKDVLGVKNPESAATQKAKGPSPSSSMQSASDKANTSNSDDGHEAGGKPNSSGTASNENSANSQQMANRTSPSDPNAQNPGLMDRMKDAVSSLFAKMNESPPSQSSQTPARNAAAPDQEQKGGKSDQGQSQSSSSQNSQTKADAQSQSNERGQASEVAQSTQSQSSQASDHQGGNQSKSGIGRQDGQKDLKEAQQQEAMGKLAQIIGKRSQDVTGEMMVEVPSGKQKLRTAYSRELGEHADRSGEINRDEVPLIYQDYVREYMQRVHRQLEHNN